MAKLASFWYGDTLGEIEQASIASFMNTGDQITIYSTEPIKNLPNGAVNEDASLIFPSDPIVLHKKTKSPALHSDLFRYALLSQTDEIWVDLDILALRSFDNAPDYFIGWEDKHTLNGAVLRLPKTSSALQALSRYGPTSHGVPPIPNLRGFRKIKYSMRARFTRYTVDQWTWGALGPLGLTYHMQETEEDKFALPISAFYHVPLHQTHLFALDDAIKISEIPDNAWALHLWGSRLRKILLEDYDGRLPSKCFVNKFAYENILEPPA
ncbi:hypothetical protein [Nereida sp. MMG025]|uniref:hypothetical protein n=1 Tax=Nereida sp. MMG025 TaxID=2909981 RepID=UPI001F3D4D9B|nr:hypothetical protein [Nereida sp. MMG025]MCF6444830.1 hypothetical protein [Nereida sp. MMG025]